MFSCADHSCHAVLAAPQVRRYHVRKVIPGLRKCNRRRRRLPGQVSLGRFIVRDHFYYQRLRAGRGPVEGPQDKILQ